MITHAQVTLAARTFLCDVKNTDKTMRTERIRSSFEKTTAVVNTYLEEQDATP